MCTECEECHWLHFSKGRAEAHVLRDVRQYSGGSKMLVFWPNEWPLCGQHQILIQNQNPLRQSPLRNIPDPLRHIVSVQSNAKHLCGFQSNLIRFLISEAKPIFQTEGQIPTKQQKQKLEKGEKKVLDIPGTGSHLCVRENEQLISHHEGHDSMLWNLSGNFSKRLFHFMQEGSWGRKGDYFLLE